MKQETLEEAAERYYEDNIDESNIPREHYEWEIQDLMIGFAYQWQQEQDKKLYSEEDLISFYNFIKEKCDIINTSGYAETHIEWFKHFKKIIL